MLTTSFPLFASDRAGIFVYAFSRELARRGLAVTVVAPHHKGALLEESWDGIRVERFRYLYPASLEKLAYGGGTPSNLRRSWLARVGLPFFAASFWWRARRLARDSEILHAHWIPSGLIGLLSLPSTKRPPLVVSVWGSDLALIRTPVIGRVVRRLLRGASAIFAVSDAMKKELVRLGIPAGTVHVVLSAAPALPRPAQTGKELRGALGLPLEGPIVLYLGRLSSEKGPHHLLEAAQKVLSEAPEAFFVLVGDGQMSAELEEWARARGMEKSVRFTGFVPHDQIGAWLTAADFLVLPSLSEGLPHAVMEAMAFELPVIASRVGGVPEIVQDGVNGYLVPPGEPGALAERILHLIRDGSLRRRLGEAGGRFIVERELKWDRYAREVLAVYETVLARKAS